MAAMSHGLVLDPPSALVELGVGQFHDMEWIGDLGGGGQLLVEDGPVGTRQVERRPSGVVPPLLPFRLQPLLGLVTTATWDDVKQLACLHVDDLGGELVAAPWTDSGEEHLVETEGLHRSEPVFGFHQGVP